MRFVAAVLCLVATASSADGQWAHSDPARPFDRHMTELPQTDADLDRAGRETPRLHNLMNDVAEDLNIRDGKAQLFDERGVGTPAGSELSGSLDAHGATLRLRW